ncbi:cleavage and polyadenylation specific factor 5 [Jaminaea rosea]|uniref:Cleavage and polyadenylation specificity factor subunit 5 n=1 Tax=Jaminaea rosea TaxID=1569628 RepID=A0A316UNF7_9BASI|nr:cleavage and polyadenylation specific factor 5 [Jaminaea rosea]PWN26809.1 cleavage and polyadenylation specific factor 5 [Jaminaea rosea]
MASPIITLQPLSAYTFTTKAPQPEEDPSVSARLQRLQNNYEDFGMRRSTEAVLLVHEHGHPHVLLIQVASSFWKLPGDYLRPGEDEIQGLSDRLDERLMPDDGMDGGEESGRGGWDISDCIATWWRPSFETFMYPYIPPHITKPKECKKLYLVQPPPKATFAVPSNLKLLAIPLCDLYDGSNRFGAQLAAIPHLLSRYQFVCQD